MRCLSLLKEYVIECDDEYQEERGIPPHGKSVVQCAYICTCIYTSLVATFTYMTLIIHEMLRKTRQGNTTQQKDKATQHNSPKACTCIHKFLWEKVITNNLFRWFFKFAVYYAIQCGGQLQSRNIQNTLQQFFYQQKFPTVW